MARTTFEKLWDDYLEKAPLQRAAFLLEAAFKLGEQGEILAQAAFLNEALAQSLAAADSKTASQAFGALARQLRARGFHRDAIQELEDALTKFEVWDVFEQAICHRELAWTFGSIGDHRNREANLLESIARFGAIGLVAWAFPLQNELAELHLARDESDKLRDILSEPLPRRDSVAPIAWGIRHYLLGRLSAQELHSETALCQLVEAMPYLEGATHRLHDPCKQTLLGLLSLDSRLIEDHKALLLSLSTGVRLYLWEELGERWTLPHE